MKISQSNIELSANTFSHQRFSQELYISYWHNNRATEISISENKEYTDIQQAVKIELSRQAANQSKELVNNTEKVQNKDEIYQLDDKDKLKVLLLEKMLKILTGKDYKIRIIDKLKLENINKTENIKNTQNNQPSWNWGIIIRYKEEYNEMQALDFSANGYVKTSDGKEINFNVKILISRQFFSYNNLEIRLGDAKKVDPLVLNFGQGLPQLSEIKIDFDINSDGNLENIFFPLQGSGFLALDKNNDGIINNGSELFGPTLGDGFLELIQFDDDNNNWIDENDSIFNRLKIWFKDGNNQDKIATLRELNIGAIYLGSISSYFEHKDNSSNLKGISQKTGIAVKEDGKIATIQHIDLVV